MDDGTRSPTFQGEILIAHHLIRPRLRDAVSFLAVKNQYFKPHGDHPWHYAIFGFNVGLPHTASDGSACPADAVCLAHPDPTSVGFSELPGFNFVVAFGYDLDIGNTVGDITFASTFMNELGHNFGLEHGGVFLSGPEFPPEACLAFKPHYISVMSLMYSLGGISYAGIPGSSTSIGSRVDYSSFTALTLNEADLDEFVGVGGPPGDTDILKYCASLVGCTLQGPSVGPIDWNNDGVIEAHAAGDIDNDTGRANSRPLHGFDDWS